MTLDDERVRYWLSQGASVSETMTSFLKRRGIAMPVRTRKATKHRPKKAGRAVLRKAAAAGGKRAKA
jgi:ribosomal protein S16